MPAGDTVGLAAANHIRPILAGRVPALAMPHPRFAHERRPERPAARAVHFLRFDGDRATYRCPRCRH